MRRLASQTSRNKHRKITFVARVDRVGRVAGVSASECVVPFRSDRRTGGDGDDDLGYWLLEGVLDTVTDETVGRDIGNRLRSTVSTCQAHIRDERTYTIVRRHTNAVDVTLVDTVDVHLLEDGVRGRRQGHRRKDHRG